MDGFGGKELLSWLTVPELQIPNPERYTLLCFGLGLRAVLLARASSRCQVHHVDTLCFAGGLGREQSSRRAGALPHPFFGMNELGLCKTVCLLVEGVFPSSGWCRAAQTTAGTSGVYANNKVMSIDFLPSLLVEGGLGVCGRGCSPWLFKHVECVRRLTPK